MKTTLLSILMLGVAYGANAQFNPSASVITSASINEAYAGQVIEFTVPAVGSVPGTAVAGPLISGLGLPATIAPLVEGFLGSQNVPLSITNSTLSVSGLPAGITATCDATPCTYMAGASGTITLSGTPTEGGTFSIDILTLSNGEADLSALAAQDPTGQVPSTFAMPQPVGGAWDEEGYTMSVSDPNGIEESNEVFSLSLYPTPTHGVSTLNVNATISGVATIEVYSVTGALMHTTSNPIRVGTNRVQVDFTNLNAGVYLIKTNINGHLALIRTLKK